MGSEMCIRDRIDHDEYFDDGEGVMTMIVMDDDDHDENIDDG